MSNIRLFPEDWPKQFTITSANNSTIFSGLGLGKITDAISCTVTEERNGSFELEMDYPVTGIRYSQLALRMIIVAPPNPYDDPQAFRIYSISKQYGGKVKVKAQHISYDLSDIMMKKGEIQDDSLNPTKIWNYATSHLTTGFSVYKANTNYQFMFSSDLTISDAIDDSDGNKTKKWVLKGPKSLKNILLGNSEDGLTKIYQVGNNNGEEPEFRFNNYMISLNKSRGSNRNVTIRYGKNMKGFTQEESLEKIYTHVYPFYYASSITYYQGGYAGGSQITLNDWACDLSDWQGYTGGPLLATGLKQDNGNSFNFQRILPLDVSSLYKGDYGIDLEMLGSIKRFDFHGYLYLSGHSDTNNTLSKGETQTLEFCTYQGWYIPQADQYGQYRFTQDDLSHFHLGDMVGDLDPNIEDMWTQNHVIYAHVKVTNNGEDNIKYSEWTSAWFDLNGDDSVWDKMSYYYDLTKPEDISKIASKIKKPAERYIRENHMARFPVQLKVDMTLAEPTNIKSLYDVRLCDNVTVIYPAFNVSTLAKCTKTVYDCMSERYKTLDFSNAWSGLAFNTAQNIDGTKRSFSNFNYVDANFGYLRFLASSH